MPVTNKTQLEILQQTQDATTGLLDVTLVDSAGSNKIAIDSSGAVSTKEKVSSTATLSNVASSATSVTVLAANANRLGAMVYNDSTAVLYLKFGATASTSSYTVQIASLGYYELPTLSRYTGIIDGIWASANGNARVTELTA